MVATNCIRVHALVGISVLTISRQNIPLHHTETVLDRPSCLFCLREVRLSDLNVWHTFRKPNRKKHRSNSNKQNSCTSLWESGTFKLLLLLLLSNFSLLSFGLEIFTYRGM